MRDIPSIRKYVPTCATLAPRLRHACATLALRLRHACARLAPGFGRFVWRSVISNFVLGNDRISHSAIPLACVLGRGTPACTRGFLREKVLLHGSREEPRPHALCTLGLMLSYRVPRDAWKYIKTCPKCNPGIIAFLKIVKNTCFSQFDFFV